MMQRFVVAGLVLLSGCTGQSVSSVSIADTAAAGLTDSLMPTKDTGCSFGCDEAKPMEVLPVHTQSSAKCTATAMSFSQSSSRPAIIDLSAKAAAESCNGGSAAAIAEVMAEDLAYACAKAIAETSTSCETTGNGKACAVAEAAVEATAMAVAEVSATAFATAAMECGCSVQADTMSSQVAEAIAVAHASSKSEVCVEGFAASSASNYVEAFTETFIQLWGEAIATARTGSVCEVFVDTGANFKVWNDADSNSVTKVASAASNGSASGDADGKAFYNAGGEPTTKSSVSTPDDDDDEAGAVLSGKLCFNQGMCCKHALKGWVNGPNFKDNCEGCEFEVRDSMDECDVLGLAM